MTCSNGSIPFIADIRNPPRMARGASRITHTDMTMSHSLGKVRVVMPARCDRVSRKEVLARPGYMSMRSDMK